MRLADGARGAAPRAGAPRGARDLALAHIVDVADGRLDARVPGVRRRGRLHVARGEVVDVLQRCVTPLAQLLVVLLLLWGVLAVVEQIAALMA